MSKNNKYYNKKNKNNAAVKNQQRYEHKKEVKKQQANSLSDTTAIEQAVKKEYDPECLLRTALTTGNFVFEARDCSLFSDVMFKRLLAQNENGVNKTDDFSITEIDDITTYDSLISGNLTKPVLTQLTKYICMGNVLLSAMITKAIPDRGFSDVTSLLFSSICQLNNMYTDSEISEEKVLAKSIYNIIENKDLCSSLVVIDTLKEVLGINVSIDNIQVRIPTYGCLSDGGGIVVQFESIEDFIHWCYTTNLDLLQQACNKQLDAIVTSNYMVQNKIDPDTSNVTFDDEDPLETERENIKLTKNKQHKTQTVDLSRIAKYRLSRLNKEWSLEAELKFDLSEFYNKVGSAKDLAKVLKGSDLSFYVENALAMYEEYYVGADVTKSSFINAIANDLWQMFSKLAYEDNITLVSNINIALKDKFIIASVDQLVDNPETVKDIYENFIVPGITQWFTQYKNMYEGKNFKPGDIKEMMESIDQFSMGWVMQYINLRNHAASLDKFNKLVDIVTSKERSYKNDLFTREDIRQEVVLLDANYMEHALDALERGQPDQSIVMRM